MANKNYGTNTGKHFHSKKKHKNFEKKDKKTLLEAQEKYSEWLSKIEGVTGNGIGNDSIGNLCLKVYSKENLSKDVKIKIKRKLKGISLDFSVVGEIKLE